MEKELVAGIDIGGTKTKIGLVDKSGNCEEQLFFRTRHYESIDDFLAKIVESVDELKERYESPVQLVGCGIGAPNASSTNGTIENAANLKWKGSVPIVRKLTERMNLPMRIMNDARRRGFGRNAFRKCKRHVRFHSHYLRNRFLVPELWPMVD